MNINQLSIVQAQDGLKKKKFSSFELNKACLDQVRRIDRKINAFITVFEKEALDSARLSDQKISKENDRRSLFNQYPLLGIPVAVKDIFCTKGARTTAGSKVLENYFPVYDATAIARLKVAGAIITGKTNLDAWAHGASGENSDFGPTKNPWDLSLVAGGSSSGSAAAVAADMTIFAMGTDTGGSIRFPASFCNVVGLKPTYGRVSRYGVVAMASSFDSIGHLTKSVADSAFILKITAGKDKYDSTMPDKAVPDYLKFLEKGLTGVKVGLPREYFSGGINKKIKILVREAIRTLEKLGAKMIDVSLPHSKYAVATYYILVPSEISSNLARYDGVRFGFPRKFFGNEAVRRIMLGTYSLSAGYYDAYYLKAMKVRNLIKQDFDRAFRKADIILAPVSPVLPFRIGEKVNDPLKMYLMDIFTSMANLTGIPGLALPAGFSNDLPVGIQLLGPQFSEDLLFRVGYGYEQATEWYKKRPNL